MNLIKIHLLLFFLLPVIVYSQEIQRDSSGKIKRDFKAVKTFKETNPCPATGKIQKTCPGYVVDHLLPLCGYGKDSPENMQWQTIADSKVKDRLEIMQCRAIKEATSTCR